MGLGPIPAAGAGESAEVDYRALFDAAPGLYLVLRPNDPHFTIAAANRAYAEATMTSAAEIIGRDVFDVFPDNPDDPQAKGAEHLATSLRRVLATKATQSMAVQKYDIRRPEDQGGGFEERFWSPMNAPLLGADGEVQFIIHRVEDVTELVRLKRMEAERGRLTGDLRVRADQMEAELFLRARQLAESQRLMREREEVQNKLLATEARFSLAFDQAPIGMVLLSPDGRLLEVNQAFLDMLGYSREELTARDSSFYTHPDDIRPSREFFSALRNGPRNKVSLEKRYLRRDGEILWARASGTMRRDERGQPAQVIATVEDITARKRAEARYQFLAETIPQMVWTATPDGRLDYINGQGTAYFGVTQDALLGAGWLEWVHPEERENTIRIWTRSLEAGKPYEAAFRLKRADGAWRWHLVRALAFTGENGAIAQWFGTCTDIEDQRQADANLQQQWQTFDTALSNTPDFTYIFDLSGRFTYVNRALLSLWQKTLDEANGKNFFELGYPFELAARLQHQIQQVIDTQRPVRDQTPFTGPTGETRFYDYIFVPVLDAGGGVRAVAGSTRDITEQNRAAQQIEEDRRRWRELMVRTPAGIAVLRGPEHRFEWVNPEFSRLVGQPAEALIGKRAQEPFTGIELHFYVDRLNRAYETGEPFVGHESLVRLPRAGGVLEDVYLNFAYLPTRDVGGSIDGIFVHALEVTDLVTARKRVEISEERFRAAVQANSSILWTNNAGGEMEGEQPGWGAFTGQSREEYQGFGWSAAVHPDDAQPTVRAWMQAVAERRMFVFEHRVRRHDGAWRLFSIRAVPVFDHEGAIREWVGVHNDITEERSLLNALRQSEERFRQAIDSMPQLVWSTLPDGQPDLFNKQWLEYMGDSGVAANDAWGSVHVEDEPLTRERWRQSLYTGETFEMEFRCRRRDGQYRWFLGRAQPIRDEEGRIVRWFGTSTDIEDRKKAELAVVTKQKLESLGLLAGGIAHDFNNLLVGVLGGASYASEALPETHPLQSTLSGIVSAGESAAHLTRQMLAYAGKGRFLVESIDIGELVRTTSNLVKGSIPKHVQLTWEIADNLSAIEADSGQMQQIVMNLILNAAESIDDTRKGTVAVSARMVHLDAADTARLDVICGALVPGSYLLLEVQDNGSGMDRATQTRIFDPFFTTKFTGRGLGLSAVHGILRTHNGALELKSRVGEGSTFRIFLPASGKAVSSGPAPPDRASAGAGTILVVDDEEIVRRTAKNSLELAGFEVRLADGGEQGIDALLNDETPPVDLILLDMSMPGTNGKDVMERVRLLGINVPVLICSGYSEAEVYREFSGLDIAGVIPKPFTSRQLSATIRGVLAKERAG